VTRALALALCLAALVTGLTGCADESGYGPVGSPSGAVEASAARSGAPERIVSLDYCADQYVLGLARHDRIVGLSPDSRQDHAYLRGQAASLPQVRPLAEDVLALRPDLVVRTYGGGPGLAEALERSGVRVVQLGSGEDVASIRSSIQIAATALGESERGRFLSAQMDRRLADAAARGSQHPGGPVKVLYLTPAGFTTGPGTLVDAMMSAAGLANIETRPGWQPVPLETMVTLEPELVVKAFYSHQQAASQPWSPGRHPVARRLAQGREAIDLDPGVTACAAWFMTDAVDMMAEAGTRAMTRRALRSATP
jgi:iron complex transport system substrate-binding protein